MADKNFKQDVEKQTADVDFEKSKYQVIFDTSHGEIKVKLDPKDAPKHCLNMIGLVKAGFYDGLGFHRIIDGFVIQGGCPKGDGTGGPGYQVTAEFNATKHKAGTLSMARAQDPDSAGSQFFLCLGDLPYLDNQYTVFGQVEEGTSLENTLAIGKLPTDGGDRPLEKVTINSAKIETTSL